jgi:hypothetical protein
LRAALEHARDGLTVAQQAIREKNAAELETAMQNFRNAFGPVREAARKLPK